MNMASNGTTPTPRKGIRQRSLKEFYEEVTSIKAKKRAQEEIDAAVTDSPQPSKLTIGDENSQDDGCSSVTTDESLDRQPLHGKTIYLGRLSMKRGPRQGDKRKQMGLHHYHFKLHTQPRQLKNKANQNEQDIPMQTSQEVQCNQHIQSQSSQLSHYTPDEMEYLTPQDQPVVPVSNPNTPSPLKKRHRLDSGEAPHDSDDEVLNITQDMDVLDVCHSGEESSQDWKPTFRWRREPGEEPAPENGPNATPRPPCALAGKLTQKAGAPKSASRQPYVRLPEVNINPFAYGQAKPPKHRRSVIPSSPFLATSTNSFSRYLYDFVELECLGSGSFSQVFKCIRRIDGWCYAVKRCRRHLRGKKDRQQALREAYALAALGHSPHVVRYYNAWIEDDLLYIQMEYCPGGNLEAKCKELRDKDTDSMGYVDGSQQPFSEHTLKRVIQEISMALLDIHTLQLAHLDVKPSNILTAIDSSFKLADFGQVAKADGSMVINEGDNRYLSRELLEGDRSNLQAGDIFALGATVYEMALGRPLPGSDEEWQRIRDGHLVPFRHYSPLLQSLLSSMMDSDPSQRPTAAQILGHDALQSIQDTARRIEKALSPMSTDSEMTQFL